jgi:hypothetical protein
MELSLRTIKSQSLQANAVTTLQIIKIETAACGKCFRHEIEKNLDSNLLWDTEYPDNLVDFHQFLHADFPIVAP